MGQAKVFQNYYFCIYLTEVFMRSQWFREGLTFVPLSLSCSDPEIPAQPQGPREPTAGSSLGLLYQLPGVLLWDKIGYLKASSPGSIAWRIVIGFCLSPPVAARSLLSPSLSYHLHISDLLLCSWPYLQGWLWERASLPPGGVFKQAMLESTVKHTVP